MEFEFGMKKVNFEDIKKGDAVVTMTYQTFLLVMDDDGYYRCVNLTRNEVYDENFTDLYDLCKYINNKSKILKHIPSDNLLLSLVEAKDEGSI